MKHIYDSVHRQYTPWSPQLLDIINTTEFQRLKRIKQLGACHHVFPSATHTRFEHSLGVGYLARKCIESLKNRQPELNINEDTVLTFQLAGLCHDLGHGPVSHAFDHFLNTLTTNTHFSQHEERSVDMLHYIVDKYNVNISSTVVDNACELICPTTNALPKWWYQIIANDETCIDVDKFDYLLRDTHMTGMVCNDVDVNRFIDYARVVEVIRENKTEQMLCYPEKLQFDINQLFLTRHRLHAQVYQHPTVRAFEMMYTDILHTLKDEFKNIIDANQDIEWLLDWTDDMFTNGYLYWFLHQHKFSKSKFEYATHLLQRIHMRQHYTLMKEIKCNDITECKHRLEIEQNKTKQQTENTLRVDTVTIGYETNPFYNVFFYSKTNPLITSSVKNTSAIFPYHLQDCIIRLYNTNDNIV